MQELWNLLLTLNPVQFLLFLVTFTLIYIFRHRKDKDILPRLERLEATLLKQLTPVRQDG